jgi:hypothetical protein
MLKMELDPFYILKLSIGQVVLLREILIVWLDGPKCSFEQLYQTEIQPQKTC